MAQWDTEAIVREVLRRIAQLANQSAPAEHAVEQAKPAASDRTELRLNERLVTLALVNGKLDGIRHVVIPANAVVTPAVRDELRLRNIDWRRANAASTNGSIQRGGLSLLLATEDSSIRLRDWSQTVKACETVMSHDSTEIAAQIGKWVDATHVAVAWSRRPLLLACKLNKQAAVRAAAPFDADQLRRAIDEVQPNVLVLDSAADGAWTSWIDQFRNSGPRRDPL